MDAVGQKDAAPRSQQARVVRELSARPEHMHAMVTLWAALSRVQAPGWWLLVLLHGVRMMCEGAAECAGLPRHDASARYFDALDRLHEHLVVETARFAPHLG